MGQEKFTEEEKKKVEEIFKDFDKSYNDFTIEFSDTSRSFHVHKMYSYIEVNFDLLSKLSEIFNTKNIATNFDSVSGCETCDYGSNYEVTFTIQD